MRAESLVIRLGEEYVRSDFFVVYEQSAKFILARARHNEDLVVSLYQQTFEGTRVVHAAAAASASVRKEMKPFPRHVRG